MRRRYRQIIIRFIIPREQSAEDEFLDTLYVALGFGDEKDEVGKMVFKEIIKSKNQGISSKEIMERSHVSQAAIIYHLNNLLRSGFVVKEGKYYYLRGETVSETLRIIEEELILRLERLRKMANELNL